MPAIPQKELARLKEQVLRAVLSNGAFPGSDRPLRFPDLPFVLSQPEIYLLDNDIAGDIPVEGLEKSVQVVSDSALSNLQPASGKLVFFQFETSGASDDRLDLRLDAKVQSAGESRKHSLTSLDIKLVKVGDEWQISGDTTSLSA